MESSRWIEALRTTASQTWRLTRAFRSRLVELVFCELLVRSGLLEQAADVSIRSGLGLSIDCASVAVADRLLVNVERLCVCVVMLSDCLSLRPVPHVGICHKLQPVAPIFDPLKLLTFNRCFSPNEFEPVATDLLNILKTQGWYFMQNDNQNNSALADANYLRVIDFMRTKRADGYAVMAASMVDDRVIYTNDLYSSARVIVPAHQMTDPRSFDNRALWRDSWDYHEQLYSLLHRDKFIGEFYHKIRRVDGSFAGVWADFYFVEDHLGIPMRIVVSRPDNWELLPEPNPTRSAA
ncbi:hypothetical protein NG799_19005 [Laspinema sp. D1]|uniref:PH domain-containing protein n=1 Tax=Laspinema palackyanum D2a TaxID=2953684 RepID=A0ABT2MWY3_9CYAN|nr:hypothetical protein [Laspinema sp. D2a]